MKYPEQVGVEGDPPRRQTPSDTSLYLAQGDDAGDILHTEPDAVIRVIREFDVF